MASFNVKERARQTFTVTNISGDYASERITFGVCAATNPATGEQDQSYLGVTALIESIPTGATVEFWLPQVADGNVAPSARTDLNYFYSGLVLGAAGSSLNPTGAVASFGSASWPLCGYPGAQLRVKSAGISGVATISATAD